MFRLDSSHRLPFDKTNVDAVPRSSGVYIIYDLAGPIYAGRSRVDIHRRLQSHFDGTGNDFAGDDEMTLQATMNVYAISMGQVIATWLLPGESAPVRR